MGARGRESDGDRDDRPGPDPERRLGDLPQHTAGGHRGGLETVAACRVPHCLEARPGGRATAKTVAERRGLVAEPDIPLMATVGGVEGPRPDGLVVRELEPAEASLHCEVAGPAFGAPP